MVSFASCREAGCRVASGVLVGRREKMVGFAGRMVGHKEAGGRVTLHCCV